MNEKGYTLIELLAVLAIMAAILLVAVPSISKQLATIEENNYTQFKQNIFLATESYINAKPDQFSDLKTSGGSVCIETSDLISGGWIKSSLTNPKTNKTLAEQTSSVLVTNSNSEYIYTYYPESDACQ